MTPDTIITRCCNTCGHAFEPSCAYDLVCPECQQAHMAKLVMTRQEYVDQLAAEEAEERQRQEEILNSK